MLQKRYIKTLIKPKVYFVALATKYILSFMSHMIPTI